MRAESTSAGDIDRVVIRPQATTFLPDSVVKKCIASLSVVTNANQDLDVPCRQWVGRFHTCQLLESWSRDTWDVMWFRLWSRSDHCEDEAHAFRGGPGAYCPGKFWKSRLSISILWFGQWFYTFPARKIALKYIQSFLPSEENDRRLNLL